MSVVEVKSSSHHDEVISKNPKVVIFFGSKNCGFCHRMKPVVDDMSKNNREVVFAHVETTKIPTDNLEAVPIFVGYRNGTPSGKVRGADVQQLQTLVREL